jgi:hypothetical protein
VAHFFVAQVVDALAFEQDLARGHTAWRFEQADDGRAGERLARARFTHHAQDLAGCDGERDVVQSAQGAATAWKFDDEVFAV